MGEETTVTITGASKTILLSIVGTLLLTVLIGLFIPNAREYVITTSKMLLGAVPMFVK